MLIAALAAVTVLAGPLSARQVPTKPGQYPTEAPEVLDPNPKSDHGCPRPDVQQTKAAISASLSEPKKAGPNSGDKPKPNKA